MLRRHKRLLLLVLVGIGIGLYVGCTQPEDILTDKSQTTIVLTAERLPTNPVGMLYELWVTDQLIGDSVYEAVSMGKFGYDFVTSSFLDTSGALRENSNRFVLQADILDYDVLFISVQRADGSGPSPGPVMLMDTIRALDVRAIDMVFPLSDSLWQCPVEFNMESMSDGRDSTNDGAGVWFCVYNEMQIAIPDTTDTSEVTIITKWKQCPLPDSNQCIESIIELLNVDVDTIERVFGFDKDSQIIVTYDVVMFETCCDSGVDSILWTDVTIRYSLGGTDTLTFDSVVQSAIPPLPDYTSFGWKYKGWVVSSVIEELGVSMGKITPPAWRAYNNAFDSMVPGIDGGLLTTGSFSDIYLPDDGNPYVDSAHRVPPYPGEDFLKNLPGGHDVKVQLVPGGRTTGTIFVTLEPVNYVTDTTNFPLFLMIHDLPDRRADVINEHQQFSMWGRSYNTGDDLVGFPVVHVDSMLRQ